MWLLGQWILELADFRSLEIHEDNRLCWVLSVLPYPCKAQCSQREAMFLPRPSPPWDVLVVGVGAKLPNNAGGATSRGPSNPVLFSP